MAKPAAGLSYGSTRPSSGPELASARCMLRPLRADAVELHHCVDEGFWRQGYGTELSEAVLNYCFTVLQMRVVRASTDAANTASARVLQKLEFTLIDRRTVASLDTLFYERQAP